MKTARRLPGRLLALAAALAVLIPGPGVFAGPVTKPIPPSARSDGGFPFQMGPQTLRMPAPAGLCEPYGVYSNFAARLLQASQEGRLLLLDCAEMAAGATTLSHMLIITTVRMPGVEGLDGRALAARMAALPARTWGAAGDYAGDAASDRLESSGMVKGAKLKMGMTPVGAEDDVFYVTGLMQMSGNGRSAVRAVAMAITVVRGQPLMLTISREGNGPDEAAAALAEVRVAVAALLAANM